MDFKRFASSGKDNPMSDASINKKFMQHKRRLHYDKRHGKVEDKKSEVAKKMKKDGFDSHKRWGNSAVKGQGVNSLAMMEARRGFAKKDK